MRRATAAEAFALGRQGLGPASFIATASLGSLWQGLQADLDAQWQGLSEGIAITPILSFDENRLAFTLKRIAQEIDLPPREGSLAIAGLEVTGMPGQPGRSVNVDQTRAAVVALVQAGQSGTVDLVVEERLPAVMSVAQAETKASALLRTSLSLTAEGLDGPASFAVDSATLRQWLTFVPMTAQDGVVELDVTLIVSR